MPTYCKEINCTKQPSYGKLGSKISEYCKKHALPSYVNTRSKQCKEINCNKVPNFGKLGSKIAEYCKKHALTSYVNVKSKQCKEINCKTRPNFGKLGSKIAEYCKKHALPSYVNVKHKKCNEINCTAISIYGKLGSKIAEYCKKHALPSYIDVFSKRCKEINCTKQPNYGKLGSKIAEYCKKHALPNYVNVFSKRCKEINCTKQPSFGKLGSKIAEYCKKHALTSYVKDKHCNEINCKTIPRYGMPGYSVEFCSKHKFSSMVINSTKIKNIKKTLCNYCSIVIHYSKKYCSNCYKYNEDKGIIDENINESYIILKKQYEIDMGEKKLSSVFKIKPEKKVYRATKEISIKTLLEEHKIDFIHNKTADSKCTGRRPDFNIICNWGILILEVDEHQHSKSYPCSCELKRMKEIYMALGVSKVLFIRYNPDKYKTIDNVDQASDIVRQTYLIKYINQLRKKSSVDIDYNLGGVYLYYDGFLPSDELDVEKFNPYEI
jgi:hypothetical protein